MKKTTIPCKEHGKKDTWEEKKKTRPTKQNNPEKYISMHGSS